MKVVVLGASDKEHRYSYKAILRLEEAGHEVLPVHPTLEEIRGHQVYPSIKALPGRADTVTLYVGPERSAALAEELVDYAARRYIFNPGTENPELEERLRADGRQVLEACTLVMLSTGQF